MVGLGYFISFSLFWRNVQELRSFRQVERETNKNTYVTFLVHHSCHPWKLLVQLFYEKWNVWKNEIPHSQLFYPFHHLLLKHTFLNPKQEEKVKKRRKSRKILEEIESKIDIHKTFFFQFSIFSIKFTVISKTLVGWIGFDCDSMTLAVIGKKEQFTHKFQKFIFCNIYIYYRKLVQKISEEK